MLAVLHRMAPRIPLALLLAACAAVSAGVHGQRTPPGREPAGRPRLCWGTYDTVISGGVVVTGDGTDAAPTDVAIAGDRIACIGHVETPGAAEVISAAGLHVTPGFIDVHTHADGDIGTHPLAANFLAQGVTTVVGGNCGGHAFPLAQLFEKVSRQGAGVNVAALAGHNTIRRLVMGYQVSPVGSQLDEMKALVEQEMLSGAIGLSTGLAYRPGPFATTEEVIALATVAARYGGIYATHMRDEGSNVRDSVLEAIRIGETNGMRVQISHIKLITQDTWGRPYLIRDPVEAAIRRGVRVTTDQHPYTATSTSLLSMIPPWAWGDGFDDFLRVIDDADQRAELVRLYSAYFPFAFDRFMVATCPSRRECEGLTLRGILDARHQTATAESGAELLIELQATGWAQGIFFVMRDEDVEALMPQPYNMIISDGSAVTPEDGGFPHPRNFGTFPRVLRRFVVERRLLTLEQAIHKMTALPARTFGFEDRGVLRRGAYADLVLFDLATVRDTATYTDPYRAPIGIRHVIVNGRVAVRDGVVTGVRAGRVIRGPAAGRMPDRTSSGKEESGTNQRAALLHRIYSENQ